MKKLTFKCPSCGSESLNTTGSCCGISREMLCNCGSGKMAKECCYSKEEFCRACAMPESKCKC